MTAIVQTFHAYSVTVFFMGIKLNSLFLFIFKMGKIIVILLIDAVGDLLGELTVESDVET